MDNDKLTLGSIMGAGVLVSSLVIGTEPSAAAPLIDPELNMNSESVHEIVLDNYADEPPEIEVIEAPVVKKMVFQFKKPVKLEFS